MTVKWLIKGISNLLLSVYESYESGADTVTVKVKYEGTDSLLSLGFKIQKY